MKNKSIIILLSALCLFFFIAAVTTDKKKKIDTKVEICITPAIAKIYIDAYAKRGYQVAHLVSQSVSTSIQTSSGTRYHGKYRDLQGSFVLVMTKEIYE
jgi:hypothetical protein